VVCSAVILAALSGAGKMPALLQSCHPGPDFSPRLAAAGRAGLYGLRKNTFAMPCSIPAGDTFSSRGHRPRNRRGLKADPEGVALRLVGTHNGHYINGMRPFQGRTPVGITFRGRCPRLLNKSPAGIARDVAYAFFRSP
jgi:hypothetical protein